MTFNHTTKLHLNPKSGRMESVSNIAREYGVSKKVMQNRLARGLVEVGDRTKRGKSNKAEMLELIAGIDARKALIAAQNKI